MISVPTRQEDSSVFNWNPDDTMCFDARMLRKRGALLDPLTYYGGAAEGWSEKEAVQRWRALSEFEPVDKQLFMDGFE